MPSVAQIRAGLRRWDSITSHNTLKEMENTFHFLLSDLHLDLSFEKSFDVYSGRVMSKAHIDLPANWYDLTRP